MEGNLINYSCFLKFTISVRVGHFDYSSRAPKGLTTPRRLRDIKKKAYENLKGRHSVKHLQVNEKIMIKES